MAAVLMNSWALFLGVFLLMVGNSLGSALIGVRGNMEGYDPTMMGYVISTYFIGLAVGSILTPRLLKRVGHVRVFAAYGSLVSAAFIMYAAIVHPVSWGFMRLVVGICFSGIYIVAESWLNEAATNETRGKTLSAYAILQSMGVMAGQSMIVLGDAGGYNMFVLISVIVSISFAPILLSAAPAPKFEAAVPMSVKELFKASPLGCCTSFVIGGVFSAMFGMTVVYATDKGMEVSEIATFGVLLYLGGMILQYPIGWLSDRMDRRIMIISCATAGVVTALAGMMADEWLIALYIIAFIFGGIANPMYSLAIAHTNDFLDTTQMAAASGGLIMLNGLGAMFGPIIVGYLMALVGPSGYFLFLFVLMSFLLAYGLYRMTRRPAPSQDETLSYTAIPAATSIMAGEIYQEAAIYDEAESAEAAKDQEPSDAEPTEPK